MDSRERAWRERGLRAAVLAGDEAAWRAWYDESFEELYATVLWRCGGLRDWADEITQETWLIAVRRMGAFDPDQASFLSWLRGIAANVLRNQLRQRRRQSVSLNAHHHDVASEDHGPSQRDTCEQVARALAALSERYEAVLRAKYLDRQSVADIAANWNESPKAIESLLTRARQAFREAYGDRSEQP